MKNLKSKCLANHKVMNRLKKFVIYAGFAGGLLLASFGTAKCIDYSVGKDLEMIEAQETNAKRNIERYLGHEVSMAYLETIENYNE